MIQEHGKVRQLNRFRTSLFSVSIELPHIARTARPGQFVHLKVANTPGILLRRPLSIAGIREDLVRLIVRIVGRGTEGLARLQEGDICDVIGPLGKGFQFDEVDHAILLGGGIGDAPLLFLQDVLKTRNIPYTMFIGGRDHAEFPLEDDEVIKRKIIACTDDGSYGEHGFVTAIFEQQVKGKLPDRAAVFSCGPMPMMRAAVHICEKLCLPHQVSLENRMGCAVGVCQGCALKLQEAGERGGYGLVCLDGPVFDAAEIDWDLVETGH